MKECSSCKTIKELSLFSKDSSRKDGLQACCKPCKQKTSNKYYLSNKEKVKLALKDYRTKLRKEISDLKEKSPCADCSIYYPYFVMQFDHRGDKKFQISKGKTNKSRADIFLEISKCDIVCANCHAVRTYRRQHKLEV